MDVGAVQAAFEQLQPELMKLDASVVMPVRVELQMSAAVAYSVAIRDSATERRNKLALVAQEGLFNMATLDRLPLVALAAWHVRRKQKEAMDAASTARVPEATLKQAQQTRSNMLHVLTYYYESHAEYGKRIEAIRAGSGYLDLANDLVALAEFYEVPEVQALISRDPVCYQAGDPQLARGLAQTLFRGIGLTGESEVARLTDLAQRAWTLLSQYYDALSAAGRLVFRKGEDVEVTYPSLVSAVRAPAAKTAAPQPTPAPSPEPAAASS